MDYFPYWCKKMKSFICAQDYDICLKVINPYEISDQINIASLKTKFENNCKARNYLLNGISHSDFDRVSHIETTHEIWNALKQFLSRYFRIQELRRDVFKKDYC